MYQQQQMRFGPRMTPGVKVLIIVNVVVFVVQLLFKTGLRMGESTALNAFEQVFALSPDHVLSGKIWQIFTYQFLHDASSILSMHLLFNMLALWMFGAELEEKWGRQKFTKFYLVCGTGAGLFIFLIPVLFGQPGGTTLGASGAVFGILLAYAIHWPDRQLLFMFIIPIKVKYFVLIFGMISLFFTFSNSTSGGISHVGHLGGLITGYLYLIYLVNSEGKRTHQPWNLWQRYKNYKQRRLWMKRQQEMFDEEHMEQKVDWLLDKISRDGIKSLSAAEKKFLKKASQSLDDEQPRLH